MKLQFDYHTHTLASGHGTTDTITDMAKEALLRELPILGISDHGPASLGSAGLSYFRGLSLAERHRCGIRLLYGVEANILDFQGNLDIPDEILQGLDFAIISMHNPIYRSGSVLENTLAYIRAMEHPKVQFIGHCDDSRFSVDYKELVTAAKEHHVQPELNNVSLMPDSYRQNCRENSIRLLKECEKAGCPIILSSDSHGRQHIGEVSYALALVEEIAFPHQLISNIK